MPNRRQLLAIAAAIILAGSWFYIIRAGTARPESGMWFYDLATNERFVMPRGTVAPVQAPSGGEGVEVVVYGCGACDDSSAAGYLVKHTPALKQQLEAGDDIDPQAMLTGRLIRAAGTEPWLTEGSPEARAVKAAIRAACGEKRVVACYP